LALVLSAFTGCGGTGGDEEAVDTAEAADTVYTNGKVYTVDAENTVAQAVAVKDGVIAFVGSDEDAQAYIGEATEVVDLNGKIMMPGLIDTHVHRSGTALTELYDIYLYESITKEQTLEDIRAFIEANPDLEVYWGAGYTVGMAGDPKGPKAEWLDEICDDKPIILKSNDGHNLWLNSIALEMNGITPETEPPTGGTVHVDPITGELWGSLTDAGSLVTMTQTYEDWQITESIDYFQEYMHAWGYTSIMSISDTYVESFAELESNGELTMRVNAGLRMNPGELEPQIEALNQLRDTYNSDLINITTAKFFADGVIEGMTGWLLEPYAETSGMPEGYVSEPYWEQDMLNQFFAACMENGYQIHIHSIGDASTKSMLDGFEYAVGELGEGDYRNVLTHLQVVRDEDKVRMGELDIIGSLQPFWHFKEPEWWEYVDLIALGEERAWTEYPAKSLQDQGVLLTFSGDHPVSPVNNPFWAIEAAVTRNLNNPDYYGVEDITDMDDPTWLLNPDERVDVLTALQAYTINGAFQLFREDSIGSLEVGKFADLIVVDQDIFEIDPIRIDSTQVLATVFNGQVVYGGYEF
ncbi:MAG: amidohydrolase, partial [Bacillota bacterium]|nr:amidohydrolase [Bacillota bacterium]